MSHIAESKWDKTDSVAYSEIGLYNRIPDHESSTAADTSSRPTNHSYLNSFISQRAGTTVRPHSNSTVDTPAELTYAEIHPGYAEIVDPYLVERGLQTHLQARASEVALDDEVTVIENVNFYF